MRLLTLSIGAAVAALGASSLQAARIVEYAIDDATLAKQAAVGGLPAAALPGKSQWHIGLEIDPAVDHEVISAGISCSAWTIQNPLSKLIRTAFTQWDKYGAPAGYQDPGTDIRLKLSHARTFSRCVMSGEMASICISRVSIDGMVGRGASPDQPFHVEIDKPTKVLGFCAGLTGGVGLVSRAAVASTVEKVAALAAAPAGEDIPATH